MTFSEDDPRTQFNFRCDPPLAEAIKERPNQSEFIRSAIREKLGRTVTDESGRMPPEEDDLADGWNHLKDIAGERRWIDAKEAIPEVSNRMNINADTVKRRIVYPLNDRGYVRISGEFGSDYQGIRVFR